MQIFEAFKIAVQSIIAHKLRSSLTLLGVVIGVMTIISTMSIIKGVQKMMEEEMRFLAAGVFQIRRYDPNIGIQVGPIERKFRPKMGMKEYRALKKNVTLAENIAAEAYEWGKVVKYGNKNTPPNIDVIGLTPEASPNRAWYIEQGRFINEVDIQYARPVVVIGDYIKQRLFPYRNPVGEYVDIAGHRVQVVGVLEKKGSAMNQQADYLVCLPITTFSHWFGSRYGWNFSVAAKDPGKMDQTIEQAIAVMRSARGLKPGEPNNFGILHSNQLVDSFDKMTAWIRYAAFGIASISLLVAGVGIMNIMLVSVTERTREIGLRKALGAKSSSVMGQFLVEAVILTEIGALIGVMVGLGMIFVLKSAMNLSTVIPVGIIILSLIFCSFVGLLFGTWPAWKAAKLNPIEALRYE